METAIERKGIKEGKKPWGLVSFDALAPLAEVLEGWQNLSHAHWEALECMVKVAEFGAKKYAPNNWKKGYRMTEAASSLYRHIIARLRGEYLDPESGLPHDGHILCNLMFLSYCLVHREELDDRVHSPVTNYDADAAIIALPDESEALHNLLTAVGAFMEGNDKALGVAMHYACVAHQFTCGL